jgi:aminoglycoside 3-N-acetyltransferase I
MTAILRGPWPSDPAVPAGATTADRPGSSPAASRRLLIGCQDTILAVRRLGPPDVACLRKLNAQFGAAFAEPATYGDQPPDDAYLEGLLGKAHVVALVALEADTVVGGLVAYELDKFERARREIHIYDLAVDERHRRRGVATALIGRLRDLAAERGAWVVYVQADYGDEPALALYAKLGTREEVLHFDVMVNPSS